MTDVILTTVANYGWNEIKTFANSVERSGFQGDKVMFVQDVAPEALELLTASGWTLISVVADPSQSYATARHIPVRDYLARLRHNIRYALYIDVRDAVFQSSPIPWLEANLSPATHVQLIGPSECMLIKHQPTNSEWIRNTLGEDVLSWLGEYDVLCCGTIIGTSNAVFLVVAGMCELAEKISGWGYDQAYFNYLLRTSPLKEVTREVNMSTGFIATCSWYLSCPAHWAPWVNDRWPNFDRDKRLVCAPDTSIPFPVLHQYDRDDFWRRAIEEKYS